MKSRHGGRTIPRSWRGDVWGDEETRKDDGEEETKKKSCPDKCEEPVQGKARGRHPDQQQNWTRT